MAIGVGLLHFSNQVLEYDVNYTQCPSLDPLDNGKMCKDVVNDTIHDPTANKNKTCQCSVDIEIEADMVCICVFIDLYTPTNRPL